MCSATDHPPYLDDLTFTSGQRAADEGAADRARASASVGVVSGDGRPGQALWEMVEAEIRDRWSDRPWYRHRRELAVGSARTLEYASAAAAAWNSLIADNDRELRTLIRVLRRARRR